MKLKKTNHLDNHSERIHSKNCLPRSLLAYYQEQQALTDSFCSVLEQILPEGIHADCQVVRLDDGELVISTTQQTLANYLRYLSNLIVERLVLHEKFSTVCRLHIIYLEPKHSVQKSC